jgi:lysozyme
METLQQRCARHEGLRLKPYLDTAGKLTIGYGRNLDDCGIRQSEADAMLANDLLSASVELNRDLPFTAQLMPSARREVMVEMAMNLGMPKLLQFHDMIACLKGADYAGAADAMLDSRWAGQVGDRARELAEIMRTGVATR